MNAKTTFTRMMEKIFNVQEAHAHCDIPCGIYDPYPAQIHAHTIIRMVHLIQELDQNAPDYPHKYTRYTMTKEEHAEKLKREIRILWGDYFKPTHEEQYPELTTRIWDAMRLASKVRQEVNMEASKELLESVHKIAEIFWATKGVPAKRIQAPYPTGGELVVPQ